MPYFLANCDSLLFFCDYSARPKIQDGIIANGEASNSKKKSTSIDDVLQGLVEWLCEQVCIHLFFVGGLHT